MHENEEKETPPLKIEGQGSWIGEAYFLLYRKDRLRRSLELKNAREKRAWRIHGFQIENRVLDIIFI